MLIRRSSSGVTSLMDDRLQSVEGWCSGGEPSVACRMPKILAVCEVRKSSAVKAGAPEVHSGWTWRRPRRVLNVDHRRLGSLAWEMILSSQYARSFSQYLRCILRTNCTQVAGSDGILVRLNFLSWRRACRRKVQHSLSNHGDDGH